jgi:hypothetical protein
VIIINLSSKDVKKLCRLKRAIKASFISYFLGQHFVTEMPYWELGTGT